MSRRQIILVNFIIIKEIQFTFYILYWFIKHPRIFKFPLDNTRSIRPNRIDVPLLKCSNSHIAYNSTCWQSVKLWEIAKTYLIIYK